MATKKVFEVDETSIVDLKAELFRKEQQFRKEGGSGATTKTSRPADSKKKPPVWSKQPKNTTSQSRTQRVQENDGPSEDEKSLQKSRQMLEAKAALYEKMAKGEIEENEEESESGEGRFLVDFHKKIYNSEVKRQQDDEDDSEDIGPPTPPPSCPEEEWVDYVDSLGRSRKCLKKDLKELQERDREMLPRKSPSPPTLLSDDMRREIMRKKWEQEEEEARTRPVGPVHYQTIQFDEVRHHGVGYYQFSKVEEERQKQMETLKQLREETLDQRSRIEKIKDRRKAALEARLAKVRARKRAKTGEDIGDEEVSSPMEDKSNEEHVNKNEEKIENKEKKEMEAQVNKPVDNSDEEPGRKEGIKTSRKTELPEWARHKIAQPDIANNYLKRRREEREEDFAPPSFYYETTNKDSKQEGGKKPWRGSKGQRLSTHQDDRMSSYTETSTAENTTQEMEQVRPNDNAVPQYPPYPPPAGNLLPSFQPSQQSQNYPPLPLPPQENPRYPPPCFPPFPPPQYYGTMPPPPLQPPWLPPPPWQQFPGQQAPHSQEISQETCKEVSMSKEQSVVSEQTNSELMNKNQEIGTSSLNRTQASTSSVMTSDGNLATRDQMVADFVSSLRPKS